MRIYEGDIIKVERTLTLGDGDEMCNNKFFIIGECEWNPEKGFDIRK